MTNPQYINSLMSKIQGSQWMGKEYFPINGQVLSLVQNSSNVFSSLNPVQRIAGVDELIQARAVIQPVVEKAIAQPEFIQANSLMFLRIAHSANRAYNSQLYPNISALTQKIAQLAGTVLFRPREQAMYLKGAKAFNAVFNVPVLSDIPAIQQMGVSSVGKLVPSGTPSVTTMFGSLIELSEFVLKLADIPRQFLRLGAIATSNIVTKLSSATGEIIGKYQIARLLKTPSMAPLLIPGAGSATATVNSTVWMTLLEIAPWIIAAAVIVGIALRMSEKKLTKGSDFLMFQTIDGRPGGFGHYSYDKPVDEELYKGIMYLMSYELREVAQSGNEIKVVVLDQDEPKAIYSWQPPSWVRTHDEDTAIAEWYAIQRQFFDPLDDWVNPWRRANLSY